MRHEDWPTNSPHCGKVRNLADYEIDDEFDQDSGRNSVEACRKILERANTI